MKYQRLATFAAWLLIAWSCRSDRGPTAPGSSLVQTEVRLTDAPPADASVRSVNVYIEHIDASPTTDTTGGADSQPWITLVAPHQRYDLLTLQNGTTELLGTAQLAPAEFPVGRRTGATGIHLGSSSDLHGVLTNSSWFIRALTRTAVAATSAAGSARSRVCSPVARYFSSAPGCDVK